MGRPRQGVREVCEVVFRNSWGVGETVWQAKGEVSLAWLGKKAKIVSVQGVSSGF